MRPTSSTNNSRNRQTIGNPVKIIRGTESSRQSMVPSIAGGPRTTSFGSMSRPSSFRSGAPPGVTGRPSKMDSGPQSRMSNFPKSSTARDSEFPQRKGGEINKSGSSAPGGFDEYSSSEMRDTHMGRPTEQIPREKEEEFARCTIDSTSSHRSIISDNDSQEGNGKYQSGGKRRLPESFRGSGQNGQVMKQDLKNWSRRLHNQSPPDLYSKVQAPKRKIFMALFFTSLGLLLIYLAIRRIIIEQSIENSYLQLSGGLLVFTPGQYQLIIFFLAWRGYDGYHYNLNIKPL